MPDDLPEFLKNRRIRDRARYATNPEKFRRKKRSAYAENPEKFRAQKRQWTAANREKNRERKLKDSRKYYQAHAERIKARTRAAHRARYAADPDKARARSRERYAANPQKHLELSRAWRKANPEKINHHVRKYRALKLHAPKIDFTPEQWQTLQAAFKHCCAYCGKKSKGHLTQDHIQPLSKGGSHTLSNIVPACKSCNSKKHAGPPLSPVQPLLL